MLHHWKILMGLKGDSTVWSKDENRGNDLTRIDCMPFLCWVLNNDNSDISGWCSKTPPTRNPTISISTEEWSEAESGPVRSPPKKPSLASTKVKYINVSLPRQDKTSVFQDWLYTYIVGSQMLTPTSFQGEWESNEASEDVFKDLLRVKKLSQRVSSVESKSKSPPWSSIDLDSFSQATDCLRWPRWPTTMRASSRRAVTYRWGWDASTGLMSACAGICV